MKVNATLNAKLGLDTDMYTMHSDTLKYLELKEEKLDNYSPEPEEEEKEQQQQQQHEEPEQDVPYNYTRDPTPPPPPPPAKKRKTSNNTNHVRAPSPLNPHNVLNIFAKPLQENFLRLTQENVALNASKFFENQLQHPPQSLTPDIKPMPLPSPPNIIRDEFSIYADYVANCLRKIRDQHSVIVAQNKINNILFDGAIGRYALYSGGAQEREQNLLLQNSMNRVLNHTSECSSTRKD